MGKQQKQIDVWTLQEQSNRETGRVRSRRKHKQELRQQDRRRAGLCTAGRVTRRGSTQGKFLRTLEIPYEHQNIWYERKKMEGTPTFLD